MNFASSLEQYGDHAALILESSETVSYAELARRSDSMFTADGAPQTPGSLIAIECNNALPSVCGYLGALRQRFPVLLVDGPQASEMRERLYAHYQIAHVLSPDGVWRRTGHAGASVHPDTALLLSTSGTTGSSKLVRLSANAVNANALSIALYLELEATQRPVTVLPIHYSYGLSVLNSHFAAGATVLLTAQPVTSKPFWDFFREHAATSLSGVPAIYGILKQMRFERMDLPSLQTMTQAGGRLAPPLVAWYAELAASRGWRFTVMYGQTEATARIAYVPPESLPGKADSIGIAIPGGALDIVDEAGTVISADGVTGALRYRGPNVMMGYASSVADLTLPDTQQGVLRTGDLAWRDADGYFHLNGRLKRFVKVFGNRISLDEVELYLQELGYTAAVTGRDELLVIALKGVGMDAGPAVAAISTRYRIHRSAIRAATVDEFPVSSAGKIQYAALLEQLAPEIPAQAASV